MSNTPPTPDDLSREDDAGIADLLREVGARAEPSSATMDDVRRAVEAEWRASVQRERIQRRNWMVGIAAGIATLGIASVYALRLTTTVAPAAAVATVERVEGSPTILDRSGHTRVASVGQNLTAHDIVRSNASARAALKLNGVVSVRLDNDSTIRFRDATNVELIAGALYVDAPPRPSAATQLVVETKAGAVRHLGTQYQVRLSPTGIDVGVREGRVEVSNERGVNTAAVGERMRVSFTGDVSHESLRAEDAAWQWAMDIAPAFEIENRTLKEFLEWAARESGRKLRYIGNAEAAAQAVVLKGSIAGLDVDTALTAVLSTTKLQRVQSSDGYIDVELAPLR